MSGEITENNCEIRLYIRTGYSWVIQRYIIINIIIFIATTNHNVYAYNDDDMRKGKMVFKMLTIIIMVLLMTIMMTIRMLMISSRS